MKARKDLLVPIRRSVGVIALGVAVIVAGLVMSLGTKHLRNLSRQVWEMDRKLDALVALGRTRTSWGSEER